MIGHPGASERSVLRIVSLLLLIGMATSSAIVRYVGVHSANLVIWQPIWTNTLSGTSAHFVDQRWFDRPHFVLSRETELSARLRVIRNELLSPLGQRISRRGVKGMI